MPYVIKNYDGSTRLSIADGIVDNSTSLNLLGKNVSGFGALQNENFLYLLQNFARVSPPENPLTGQLWYDTQNAGLNYYNSTNWVPLNRLITDPGSVEPNSLFFDTSKNQIFVNNGTSLELVGPETVPGFGTTKLTSVRLQGVSPSVYYPVIEIIVANEIVGIISTTSFYVNSSNSIDGITYVNRGITLKYPNSNNFPLAGTSLYSNLATTATNITGGGSGSLIYQSSTGTTTSLGIGNIGNLLVSTGSAPAWQDTNSFIVGLANNIAGPTYNATGAIPYQTASGATSFVPLTVDVGSVLTAGVSSPVWRDPSLISAGSAITAQTSTYASTALTALSADTSTYASTAINASYATVASTAQSVDWSGVQNTPNFVTTASVFPVGAIIMWYGDPTHIPGGWHLCDGSVVGNVVTPNLIDRFVVGAGNLYDIGNTGGSTDATLPSHTHDTANVVTVNQTPHNHNIPATVAGSRDASSSGGGWSGANTRDNVGPYNGISPTGNNNANISVSVDITLASTGASPTNANLPPYYALYYIMKIS